MQNETGKISQFINLISPLVCEIAKAILQASDWQVIQNGIGLDTVFSIKKDDKEAEFYLHNLLFEIATVDRDAEPLVFDENILVLHIFLDKTAKLLESKLKILHHIMHQEDVEVAINEIAKEAKHYQRIRILRLDQKPQEQNKK
jgi:hypothetical protein